MSGGEATGRATTSSTPIAVTVVGGYLGSGKTTLVNHVLATADRRMVVLVNDFGDVNIDADLIANHDGDTMELANGCICCTLVDGFAAALDSIAALAPRPERLLIEASGVADPSTVAAYAHTPGYTLDAVVVMVDTETIEASAADRYVGDAVRAQLDAADLAVLNKIDLVTRSEVDRVAQWLAAAVPGATVVQAVRGVVDNAILFGDPPAGMGRPRHARAGADRPHVEVETWSLAVETPLDRAAVEGAMAAAPAGLFRVKGVVKLAGEATPSVLHRVGLRWTLEPAPAHLAARGSERSEVVAIGLPGTIDASWLATQFGADTSAPRSTK